LVEAPLIGGAGNSVFLWKRRSSYVDWVLTPEMGSVWLLIHSTPDLVNGANNYCAISLYVAMVADGLFLGWMCVWP